MFDVTATAQRLGLGTCRDGHDAPADTDAGVDPWLDAALAVSM